MFLEIYIDTASYSFPFSQKLVYYTKFSIHLIECNRFSIHMQSDKKYLQSILKEKIKDNI